MAKKRHERRSQNRNADPPCPMCETPSGPRNVTLRTAFVFFKCAKCGHIWEMKMPQDYRIKYLEQRKKR